MKDTPETTPWFKYYITDPLTDTVNAAKGRLVAICDKVTHRWYCEYCNKYHSRRVHKYTIQFTSRALGDAGDADDGVRLHHIGTDRTRHRCICSLAAQAYKENKWKPRKWGV